MNKKIVPIGFIVFMFIFISIGVGNASMDWGALNPVQSDATYVNDKSVCAQCHGDYIDAFEKTRHSKALLSVDKEKFKGSVCEICHGPMSKHIQRADDLHGKPTTISFKSDGGLSSVQRSSVCLQCHENGKRALWSGSIHETKGLSCNTCHYVMEKRSDKSLFIGEEAQAACFKCHKQIRSQINKLSHHPIKEGKIQCADCHNPHGTVTDKLISADSINEKCYECHTEKRGPFLWDHNPTRENCLTCHTPHGSPHDKLLVAKRPYLCQRCHSDSRHPGTLYSKQTGQEEDPVYDVLSNRLANRGCSNCHSQIHGSNHPSGKTLAR